MADNILGFVATIDVTNLKAGLSQVKDAIGQAKAQFETSTASLDKWQKSSEGVGAKLEQLNTVLKAQQKSVEAYENEIKRVSEQEGDHSKQLELLQKKLQNAKNQVEKTKASIETYSKSFETLKKKEQEENSQNTKLNKSLEEHKSKLKELENQYKSAVLQHGKYSKEAKTVASEVKKTTKELKTQEKQVEALEKDYKNLTSASDKYAKAGKSLLKGVAALGAAFMGFVSGLSAAADSTEEFRSNQARLQQTFKEANLSVESLNSQYTKLYKILGDDSQTTEALTYLSQFADTEKDLNDWTSALIGVYAKFGKSLPTQELAKNINQAIQTKEVSGQLADVIKQSGGDVESFKNMLSILTDEEDRERFIIAYLKDNYTALGKEYEKNNEKVLASNEANLKYQKSLAKIGELGTSVKTSLTNLKAQALEKLYPLIEKTVNFVEKHFVAVASVVGTITAIGTALITVTASIKIYNAIVKTATAVQKAWNIAMTSNPIGLIVVAIAGLVAGIVLLIKNWDKVKEVAVACWDKIKEVWQGAKDFFTGIGDSIVSIFTSAWDGVKSAWNTVTDFFSNIGERIKGFFQGAWDGIKKIWENPDEFFLGVATKIVEVFSQLPQKFLELGKKIAENLKNGIVNTWNSLKGGVDKLLWGDTSQQTYREVVDIQVNAEVDQEEWTKKVKDLASKFNVEESFVISLQYDEGMSFEEIETKLESLKAKAEETSTDISQLVNEESEEIKEKLGETIDDVIALNQQAQEQQLTDTEKFINEKITKLKEAYEQEKGLAKGDEELNNIKKKYQNELSTIESFYNSWESQSGQTNEAIKSDLSSLKSEFTTSMAKVDKTVENTTSNMQDSFKSAMSNVSNTVSKYTSKISSYISQITSLLNDMWQQQIDNIDNEWEAYEEEYEKKKKQAEKENEEELERIEEKYENQLELLETQKEAELDENARAYQEGLIDDKQYFANKYKIMAKYNNKEEDAALEKDNTVAESGRQLTDYLKQLEDEKLAKEQEMLRLKNEAARKQFEAQKANDIANVWIQSAVAILKAFADLGPIGGAIEMAIILALAGAQTAMIASKQFTPYTELAEGGIVDKPTHALIGEDGKEAVLPLKNNTEWISELAKKLNELQQKDFSVENIGTRQQVVNNYETNNNYNYEQNITSPKALTRAEIYRDSKSLLSLKKY